MSRNTHTYMSSLLSSFHLVNSCSVCPSDDMDKLNKATIYWKMYIITFCKINKVSFNQVPINYVKAFFQNLQSLSILFMLCYVNCWGPPCWNLPDIFFKNATRLNFVVWKNENILYQFVLVFQLLVVTAHTEQVRFARSKTGTLQQNFMNVDKYVKGVK